MKRTQLYNAINCIISYWRGEGDNASSRELWHDAVIHVRWLKETGRI